MPPVATLSVIFGMYDPEHNDFLMVRPNGVLKNPATYLASATESFKTICT